MLLKQPCETFDFANPQMDPIQLAKDLVECLVSHNALGLAANQVGIPLRVFAVTSEQPTVVFNPKIVDYSEEKMEMEEQCLSFPGMTLKVPRSRFIRARFALPNGEIVTRSFSDLTARIFQHELDHLNGVTFIDIQEGARKILAQQKWQKLQKKFERNQLTFK